MNTVLDLDEGDDQVVVTTTNGVIDEDGAGGAGKVDVVDEDVDPLDRLPERAVPNADGSVTLPLLFPQQLTIRKGGKERVERFEALTFHRMNGADQRAIGAVSDDMSTVVAFSRSTRVRQAVMNALYDKLDIADIDGAGRVLNSFLKSGQRTGRSG